MIDSDDGWDMTLDGGGEGGPAAIRGLLFTQTGRAHLSMPPKQAQLAFAFAGLFYLRQNCPSQTILYINIT